MIWRGIYNFLLYLLVPFVLIRLLWRSKKLPAYRKRIAERFGYFNYPEEYQGAIWVHAVSVGETIAAIPMIRALQKQYQYPIVVTTMTPTGSEQVKKLLGNTVFHVYVPYDLPGAVNRFLKKINPRLLILMETELWFNILYLCHKNQIPILLANARLSERSKKSYRLFYYFVHRMLKHVTCIAAQSQEDAERFKQIGADLERIQVAGNIKFDIQKPADLEEKRKKLEEQMNIQRKIFMAASTHPGEEEKILYAFNLIKAKFSNALLILAPRHPDRRETILKMCQNYSYKVVLRIQSENLKDMDILILDTIGELMLFYSISTVVFVGGSLIPHGGHNLLEPALFKLPILSGPHLFNFAQIERLFQKEYAVVIVKDEKQLANSAIEFLENEKMREQMGSRAFQVVNANRGALAKHLELINHLLKPL